MVIDIQVHDPAPLVIIVHKRSGGDTDQEVKSFRLFLLATAQLKPRGHRQLLEGGGGRVSTGADNDSESRAGQIDLDAENVVVARGKLSAAGRSARRIRVLRLSAKMTQDSRGVPDSGLWDNCE
ncbi:hypothetical protein M405DRAFT_840203 [Rhizopogon salebrosus TDB-379]|nr:hypothetical protein M405DRAFT_840203 [Rhizopogon salebrosus TDB-379]